MSFTRQHFSPDGVNTEVDWCFNWMITIMMQKCNISLQRLEFLFFEARRSVTGVGLMPLTANNNNNNKTMLLKGRQGSVKSKIKRLSESGNAGRSCEMFSHIKNIKNRASAPRTFPLPSSTRAALPKETLNTLGKLPRMRFFQSGSPCITTRRHFDSDRRVFKNLMQQF